MLPLLLAFAAADLYELAGRIEPPARASVTVYGATRPFNTSTLTFDDGTFKFKKLEPGAYTIAVFVPSRGEARQTVQVGPGHAVRKRVSVVLNLKESNFVYQDIMSGRHTVTTRQLAIPDRARREYEAAQRDLAKNDHEAAVRRLEKAVELAPQFATAWNNLGTIAYQTRKYTRAEECFREALAQDPQLYEPLVNLGGVLINLGKLDEAYQHNLHAVLTRPNDALANSQLGMTYFETGDHAAAEKYLRRAVELDPAHFSNPQLLLAEIRHRQGDLSGAAGEIESFLRYRPDWPQAEAMRAKIVEWRK